MIDKIKLLCKLFESVDGFWINNLKEENLKNDYIFINNLSHYMYYILIKNKKKFVLNFHCGELVYEEFK